MIFFGREAKEKRKQKKELFKVTLNFLQNL
jgi:hypothetical protein